MRSRDIKVGEAYLYSPYSSRTPAGAFHLARRCVVVDDEPVWTTDRYPPLPFRFKSLDEARTFLSRRRVVQLGNPLARQRGRLSILVDVPVVEDLENDPATGAPWTDEQLDWPAWRLKNSGERRTKQVQTGAIQVPWVARSVELRRTWADEEARAANEARIEAEVSERVRVENERRKAEQAQRRVEAERARQATEAAIDEQRRRYDRRVRPALEAAGIAATLLPGATRGQVVLDLDDAVRLADLLARCARGHSDG